MERDRPEESRRHTASATRRATLACALLTSALAGCQTYERRPLDPAAHRDAWEARTLEEETLRAFVERLEPSSVASGALDLGDGIDLREGRLVALVFHPELRLARLRLARAAAGEVHAGLWPDPELELEAMRITESVPDRWVVTTGLAFSVPLSGRLDAERDLAAARRRSAEAALREVEWSVLREVEGAWIEWSAARLRVEETRRLAASMEDLVTTATQLAGRGELPRTEASLLRIEEVRRASRLRRLVGEVHAREQRLRGLLGLAPDAPVELVPSLAVEVASASDWEDELARRNPRLVRLRHEYAASEETLRREIAEQLPDLTLGPLFESDAGQSRIGLLGAFPLPLLNGNRRAIAEARAERELARAAVETTLEVLVARCAVARARATALAEEREQVEAVLVPLVDHQLEDALELMRLGEGSALVLLESLVRAFETKLELIDTRSAEALARIEVAHLIGPMLRPDPTAATEESR